MKPSRVLFLAVPVVLCLFAATPSIAATKPKAKAPPKVKINASDDVIESVSPTSISVKHSKTSATYAIDGHTQVLIDGRKESVGALMKGMHVTIHASSLNPKAASSIAVESKKAK